MPWLLRILLCLAIGCATGGGKPGENENERTTDCKPNEFDCGDGTCQPLRAKCNHTPDCDNERDEDEDLCRREREGPDPDPDPEECRGQDFRCDDGTCIPETAVCNKRKDCLPDGEDEMQPECPKPTPTGCDADTQFECSDGTCLDKGVKCNGPYDCPDGYSDEVDCPGKCPSGQQSCTGDGEPCIDVGKVCDGNHNDCPGDEDEALCSTGPCNVDQFHCPEGGPFGECINEGWKCDGTQDCTGNYDEATSPPASCPE